LRPFKLSLRAVRAIQAFAAQAKGCLAAHFAENGRGGFAAPDAFIVRIALMIVPFLAAVILHLCLVLPPM
jgi:hypothetical protein